MKDSGLRFFVAAASSRKVKVWADILTPEPSFGVTDSLLPLKLPLDLDLSAPENKLIQNQNLVTVISYERSYSLFFFQQSETNQSF